MSFAAAAETRGRELLLAYLSPQQRSSLDEHGFFFVRGSNGADYLLRDGMWAYKVSPDGASCTMKGFHAYEPFCHSDLVLSQMLQLFIDADYADRISCGNAYGPLELSARRALREYRQELGENPAALPEPTPSPPGPAPLDRDYMRVHHGGYHGGNCYMRVDAVPAQAYYRAGYEGLYPPAIAPPEPGRPSWIVGLAIALTAVTALVAVPLLAILT